MAQQLIPKIDTLIQNHLNVMLVGMHGVGKSYGLMAAAEKHGLKMKYYSCSTLDPFTDLVGVPYPTELEDGRKNLEMVRPREIDEANIIFFDELNRAGDTKTLNAILEIVQFHTINGEPLPNLQAVWAAVNPVDDDKYQVMELDPALVDRFDVFHELKPRVSVQYLSEFMDDGIANALVKWWNDRRGPKVDYISPRRLEKMGRAVSATDDPAIVKMMMPPGGKYDTAKLIDELNFAMGKKQRPTTGNAFSMPDADSIEYTSAFFKAKPKKVYEVISNNPSEATIDKIVEVYKANIGGFKLATQHAKILDAIPMAKLDPLVKDYPYAKRQQIKSKLPQDKNKYPNLRKALEV